MIRTGTVTAVSKQDNKITIQYTTDDGVRTAIYFNSVNTYTVPNIDDTIIINETKNVNYTVATAGNNNTEHDTEQGELKIYAVDQEEIKSSIELKKNGQVMLSGLVVVNNGENSAVKFTQLKAKFDILIATLNSFIVSYNTHTHTNHGVVTTMLQDQTEINIDDSKADNLLLDDPTTEEVT